MKKILTIAALLSVGAVSADYAGKYELLGTDSKGMPCSITFTAQSKDSLAAANASARGQSLVDDNKKVRKFVSLRKNADSGKTFLGYSDSTQANADTNAKNLSLGKSADQP